MCFLYIGDVWIDEITSLQFKVTQNKTPIYGYASQLADDFSAGQVLVIGSFSINFKESGYLWAVLRRYHQISSDQTYYDNIPHEKELLSFNELESVKMPTLTNKEGTRAYSDTYSIGRSSIERIVTGDLTTSEKANFYQSMQGYASSRVANPYDKKFEDIMDAFEDQIWKPDVTNDELISQIRRVDDNIFDNFDMYVVYGDYSNPRSNHTCKKIIGVRLLSAGQSIEIDGNPTQEFYEFYARTIA
jgi:hypothetical protein